MIAAKSGVKEVRIRLTKITVDGRRVPAGEVYWHRNPLMRAWHRIKGVFHGN